MTTDEIINRLGQVMFTYSRLTADVFSPGEVARDKQALTAAVQAVTLLEQIKKELQGDCIACKSRDVQGTQEPCASCTAKSEYWEFRWPLGEEANHEPETHQSGTLTHPALQTSNDDAPGISGHSGRTERDHRGM